MIKRHERLSELPGTVCYAQNSLLETALLVKGFRVYYNRAKQEESRNVFMIKIAICDDEPAVGMQIRSYVLSYAPECEVDLFESGEALLQIQKNYDILFLDIDMKGINGIETAKQIREYDKYVKIIYVTSYAEYVNYAFAVHAFAYLLKPVTEEAVHQQLKEARSYTTEEKKSETVSFETRNGLERLEVQDVFYFEYLDRKVHVKTLRGTYILNEGITKIAKKMQPYGFEMPHKSFAVNLFHVKSIKGYDIYMMDGSRIPLSQKKSVDFRAKLNRYIAGQLS